MESKVSFACIVEEHKHDLKKILGKYLTVKSKESQFGYIWCTRISIATKYYLQRQSNK